MPQTQSKQTEEHPDKGRKLSRQDLQKALRVFRFMWPYRWPFALGLVFLVFSTLTTLTFPYFAGQLLDAAMGKINLSINQIALLLIGILLLQAVFSFFRIMLFVKVTESAMRDIRRSLYEKMIGLPLRFFEQRRVGELISRLTSDVSQLQDVFSFTLAELFRQVATLVIGVSVLLLTSTRLTLLMVATFPVLIIAAMVFGRYIRKLSKQTQDALAEANVVVEETLQSIQAVKSFTNEGFELGRYEKSLHTVLLRAVQAGRLRGIFVSFVIFALFGAIVLVLWYGTWMVAQEMITVGELTSFIIYTAFIGGAVGGMGELYAQVQRTVGASERILDILDEQSEVQPMAVNTAKAQPALRGEIELRDVVFQYPTRPDITVLKGVSLWVEAGKKIALVGHSGAGKSTIAQLISRYYDPAQGTVLVDGRPLDQYDISHLRHNIGIVPQEVLLFGGSIRENIAYGKPEASEEEIIAAARQANAWEFISTFPEGLETLVGERGVKLSGGQRQRIAIARALLKNPAILILDEATSALDSASEKLVQEALENLMRNRTTLIIAHRLSTIRQVDTIYVINDGRIAEAGSHQELVDLPEGLYSQLVKLQLTTSGETPAVS
ncbi:ABC transporter ATP-binding protein [Eisenibacter elegans]|uniref:ABC transporter ATP-binding protein n=1 Tax=Eisenibacter elegans TaxID=997 RepID=UPI000425AD49|nr:ABC transporter transmembrane domain-containing protein [Eisenibacter elegans]